MTERRRPGARGAKSLAGHVALVAGATRGAGRGIARALGEAGATVYCTGRSVRGHPSPYGRPETIEETADMINAAGGTAIAVRVDHTVESEVTALFERIKRDHGHLDVLVNSIAGEEPMMAQWGSFWKANLQNGEETERPLNYCPVSAESVPPQRVLSANSPIGCSRQVHGCTGQRSAPDGAPVRGHPQGRS